MVRHHRDAGSIDRSRRTQVPRIEAYETDGGTVIFDGENPLAWVQSSLTLPLHQQI